MMEEAASIERLSAALSEVSMVKDIVCGADVDESKSMLKVEKDGATHFFCSNSCIKRFKADTKKYLKVEAK